MALIDGDKDKPENDTNRTLEYVVEVIRVMPYQFTLNEMGEFTSLLNERLDEILEIHKAERRTNNVTNI